MIQAGLARGRGQAAQARGEAGQDVEDGMPLEEDPDQPYVMAMVERSRGQPVALEGGEEGIVGEVVEGTGLESGGGGPRRQGQGLRLRVRGRAALPFPRAAVGAGRSTRRWLSAASRSSP